MYGPQLHRKKNLKNFFEMQPSKEILQSQVVPQKKQPKPVDYEKQLYFITSVMFPDKVLDVVQNLKENGAHIIAYKKFFGLEAWQKWFYYGKKIISLETGKCIKYDLDENTIVLWDRDPDDKSQLWDYKGNQFISKLNGKCMTLKKDGIYISLETPNNKLLTQQFELDPTEHTLMGKVYGFLSNMSQKFTNATKGKKVKFRKDTKNFVNKKLIIKNILTGKIIQAKDKSMTNVIVSDIPLMTNGKLNFLISDLHIWTINIEGMIVNKATGLVLDYNSKEKECFLGKPSSSSQAKLWIIEENQRIINNKSLKALSLSVDFKYCNLQPMVDKMDQQFELVNIESIQNGQDVILPIFPKYDVNVVSPFIPPQIEVDPIIKDTGKVGGQMVPQKGFQIPKHQIKEDDEDVEPSVPVFEYAI